MAFGVWRSAFGVRRSALRSGPPDERGPIAGEGSRPRDPWFAELRVLLSQGLNYAQKLTTSSRRAGTRALPDCSALIRFARFLLFACLCLSLSGIARAEPVIILDPYFYRTPVSEPIDGSSKTVLAYYDETGGRVTSLPNPPRQPVSELHTLAVAYAQSILKQTSPTLIRDKHGVIAAIRIEGHDPAFSSILLTPGFAGRFTNLLGKDCLVSVPNRETVYLFPRLGGNMEQFAIPLRGIYHNSVWPVSTELFEWRNGALHSIRDFEAD